MVENTRILRDCYEGPVPAYQPNCPVCGKRLGYWLITVATADGQIVSVSPQCAREIRETGKAGYQPLTGPRLFYKP